MESLALVVALGIPRYLPHFVHIHPGFPGRSGLAWVLVSAGTGYEQQVYVKIHRTMGMDRPMMAAWRVGAVCVSPGSLCVHSRAGTSQADSG